MAFVTGLLLIDAPASALNNLGNIPGARTDNTVGVKMISTKEGAYPYVSAQAFRYWLRATLEGNGEWKSAPIFREEKVAYTDANPIKYWDDDLLGYMRAPSKKSSAVEKREADPSRAEETPTTDTVTRVSPFRVSTLVALAPVSITEDFGVMARHEGDPVPHEHQFYRATLRGLFSLDLRAAGTFSYRQRTGYLNLDNTRKEQAQGAGLEHDEKNKAYRLSPADRLKRISALLDGLA
ncbi:MAG: DevR family CRISPR-associated autoregulator, partial [Candidatus Promineifilaceae bacterium]